MTGSKIKSPVAATTATGLGGDHSGDSIDSKDNASPGYVQIGQVQKNRREIVRVALANYKGCDLIDLRIFVPAEDGLKPTRKGIAIKVSLLAELIRLLETAEREATARGLIDAPRDRTAAERQRRYRDRHTKRERNGPEPLRDGEAD